VNASVLFVVSEALPYAKTGGLGDVGGALPAALASLGWDVTVVMPRYRGIDGAPEAACFDGASWAGGLAVRVLERRHADGVRMWFVDCPSCFDRDGIYGEGGVDYPDNAGRYALLARTALETAASVGLTPAVVHAHDWQAGLVAAYLRSACAAYPAFRRTRSVFTIHNLAYQGLFPAEVTPSVGLGWDMFTPEGLEFWGQLSFLKAGIVYSDCVTTVSRRYAREIQTDAQGCGMDGLLRSRAAALVGIPNGIDVAAWDPETDPLLPAHYSVKDRSGKATVKRALLDRFGMRTETQRRRPIVGMVSRMVDQKGLDLIAGAERDLMALDATYIVLGTGEATYEQMWRRLMREHPDRVAATIGFSEDLAHLIEGGSDLFLMPSRFEPCGLNQMYSLRYGTIPVVRATGGLDDTVEQVDLASGRGTGFKFDEPTSEALLSALRRALAAYQRPGLWRRVQAKGMRQDHSWEKSAREYVKLYRGRTARQPVETNAAVVNH